MIPRPFNPIPFESLNARFLEPWEVAKSFVPPPHFDHIVKKRHTILVGPRGSGKTTLLKMLQGPALEAWNDPSADLYRSRVDYTGVFVPYDRAWHAQITNLGAAKLDANGREIIGRAAFTTHVLSGLIEAIRCRVETPDGLSLTPHRRVALTRSAEADFVRIVADAWRLEVRVPSLRALATALVTRQSSLGILASEEAVRGAKGRQERLSSEEFLHIDFLHGALVGIQAFSEVAAERGARWALLFDELELAPRGIRQTLLEALRSTDQRLLFKLSLSVYAPDFGSSGATQRDDVDLIPLWFPHKHGHPFCKALLQSMLQARGIVRADPEAILGRSLFDAPVRKRGRKQYAEGSPLQVLYRELASSDPSFSAFIRAKQIDLDSLERLSESERAEKIRKIRSIVIVRKAFTTASNTSKETPLQRRRSRKNPQVYSGASSLFAVTEGNPRLFIGIMDRLIDGVENQARMVPRSRQSRQIARAAALFRAYLKTIPCPAFAGVRAARGVLSLIQQIGNAFSSGVLKGPFNPEPPGSFVVDSWVSEQLAKSLAEALDAGAIVYVPDDEGENLLGSLRGKRFRLSYLLATDFKLPLVLLRSVPLSRLLPGMPRDRTKIDHQPELFDKRKDVE